MSRQDRHLDPADLVAYREGDLPSEGRARFEQHLSACSRCAAELALVDDALSVAPGTVLEGGRSQRMMANFEAATAPTTRRLPRAFRRRRRLAPAVVLAASLALMVYGGGKLLRREPPLGPGTELRGEAQELRIRPAYTAEALEISWSPLATADSYELSLLDGRGSALLHRTLTDPRATIPLEELPPERSSLAVRIVAKADQLELARHTVALPPIR